MKLCNSLVSIVSSLKNRKVCVDIPLIHLNHVIWTHIFWWHTLKERRDCLWHRVQYECVQFTLILRNMDNTLCFVFDTFWFKFQFTIEYMNNRQRVCVFFYLIVTRRRIFRQHDLSSLWRRMFLSWQRIFPSECVMHINEHVHIIHVLVYTHELNTFIDDCIHLFSYHSNNMQTFSCFVINFHCPGYLDSSNC